MFTIGQAAGEEDLAQVIAVRYRVLRAPLGLPRASARMAGDEAAGTIHLLARDPAGHVVGVATLIESEGLQLRGMAVEAPWQGQGVGAALLKEVHALARERGAWLWCNARVGAVGFYRRCGWVEEGAAFDVPTIGPHVRMHLARTISPSGS